MEALKLNTVLRLKQQLLSPFRDVSNKTSTAGRSVDQLDGIRGLAVLIVLASHTAAFGMYAQGSLGVMLFYSLSGYVLALPFVDDPGRIFSAAAVHGYIRNRILRIVPIYWIAILITALVFGFGYEWVLWNASFIKGWNHYWSVVQEARFYLLFPLVIALVAVIPPVTRVPVLMLLAYLAYRWSNLHLVDMLDGRMVRFYFFMFLGGVFTCFLVPSLRKLSWIDRRIVQCSLSFVSLVILLGFVFTSNYWVKNVWSSMFDVSPKLSLNGWAKPGYWMIIFSVFFIAVLLNRRSLVSRLLSSYILRHLGLLSYGIYLLHMIFLRLLAPARLDPLFLFFLVLTFTYTAALISYIAIEKPFLSLKYSMSRKDSQNLGVGSV